MLLFDELQKKMAIKAQTRRILTVARNVFIVLFVLTVVAAGTLWFTLQYKPAWYRQVIAERLSPKRARTEAVQLVDLISNRLAAQLPAQVVLSDRAITGWIDVLPTLLPESQYKLPEGVSELAVRFDETGLLRVGAHVDQEGIRAIISVALRIELVQENRYLRIALDQANGGALPLPKMLIEKLIDPLLQAEFASRNEIGSTHSPKGASLELAYTVDELYEGVLIPNRFVWPNGDRPFKIDELKFSDGVLTLKIQPAP